MMRNEWGGGFSHPTIAAINNCFFFDNAHKKEKTDATSIQQQFFLLALQSQKFAIMLEILQI